VATKENGWMLSYVAITLNDYREFVAHDEGGVHDVRNFAKNRGCDICFWKKVSGGEN